MLHQLFIHRGGTWDSSVGCVGSFYHLFTFTPTKLFLRNTRIV